MIVLWLKEPMITVVFVEKTQTKRYLVKDSHPPPKIRNTRMKRIFKDENISDEMSVKANKTVGIV